MTDITMTSRGLRAIGAIMGKDLVDAFKNKDILSVLGTIVFLIALYYFLPLMWVGGEAQRVRLYDAGGSPVAEALDSSADFRIFSYDDQQTMLDDLAIASYDSGELGLVVPPHAAQNLADDQPLQLDGYLLHWVGAKNAQAIRANTERALSAQLGVPVTIDLDEHTVASRPDSMGRSVFSAIALTLIFTLAGIMVAPKLMLEEREARTLDVLLVSPASYAQILLGKALTALLMALLASVAVIIVNQAIIMQWWLVILAAICGTLFSVAVGLLLGLLFESKQQLTLWSMILFQPLLIPVFLTIMVDLIPAGVLRAFRFIPPVALSYVVRQALTPSAPLSAWGADLALVVGVTVLLLGIAVWLVRRADR